MPGACELRNVFRSPPWLKLPVKSSLLTSTWPIKPVILRSIAAPESRVGASQPLLFFPEGTLIRTPGLSAFHLGAFLAAAEAGTALVPLVLRGTRSKLRADTWFLRAGSVEVVLGPMLEPKGRDFAAALELRNAARSWMLTAVQEPDLAGS